MHIDDKLIAKLAKLSSLKIDEDKLEGLKSDLEEIVNFVDNIEDVNVDGISAKYSTLDVSTPLREDVVVQDEQLTKGIMANAPQEENGYFIVPKIIE